MIAHGTLYTNYQAGPGSLPDYLAMTSGLTGSTSGSNNIFNQLQGKGVSWGEYLESMPSTCYTGGDTGSYKKAHNPAVYYNDITSSPSACANVVPYSQFSPSHLRAFSYVVPNLADDMHDGASRTAEIQTGDAWLAANVPAMVSAGAEVIVTWDEGSTSDEHVATIAIGGTAAVGATDSHAYTHPGLLAGLEDAWGLPLLNAAQTATPLPIVVARLPSRREGYRPLHERLYEEEPQAGRKPGSEVRDAADGAGYHAPLGVDQLGLTFAGPQLRLAFGQITLSQASLCGDAGLGEDQGRGPVAGIGRALGVEERCGSQPRPSADACSTAPASSNGPERSGC